MPGCVDEDLDVHPVVVAVTFRAGTGGAAPARKTLGSPEVTRAAVVDAPAPVVTG